MLFFLTFTCIVAFAESHIQLRVNEGNLANVYGEISLDKMAAKIVRKRSVDNNKTEIAVKDSKNDSPESEEEENVLKNKTLPRTRKLYSPLDDIDENTFFKNHIFKNHNNFLDIFKPEMVNFRSKPAVKYTLDPNVIIDRAGRILSSPAVERFADRMGRQVAKIFIAIIGS